MTPRRGTPNAAAWIRPWTQMAEIAVTAPWVIGRRTVVMLADGMPPSPAGRREYVRMWTEKAEAFTLAYLAVVTTVPGPVAAGRALAPVLDRVRRNARRG